jgi:hypothetical protein
MHLNPGRLRDLVAQAGAGDGFTVCRGFADRCHTQTLQIMGRLFGFDEIEPPTVHHG